MSFFLLSLTILLFSISSNAQTLKGQYKDWAMFTTMEGKSKVCYITSNPIKKSGTYKKRGDTYILVTKRTGINPEVSIDTGYSYKKDSEAVISIDGKKTYKFFTSDETPEMAWAKDELTDKSVIGAMKNGAKVTVSGTSSRGTTSQDIYSLKGFTAAYDNMLKTCK